MLEHIILLNQLSDEKYLPLFPQTLQVNVWSGPCALFTLSFTLRRITLFGTTLTWYIPTCKLSIGQFDHLEPLLEDWGIHTHHKAYFNWSLNKNSGEFMYRPRPTSPGASTWRLVNSYTGKGVYFHWSLNRKTGEFIHSSRLSSTGASTGRLGNLYTSQGLLQLEPQQED